MKHSVTHAANSAIHVLAELMIRSALYRLEITERRQALRRDLGQGFVSHPFHYLPAKFR
ncbi:hypothetical protein [Shimia sp. Alg240-R146]|jgi:hypothetical protein|uniref:hypothetical protein n=1 Tax=Shimia sp. Alg240-R146 TaxID=2993449 RepID=UPI0022E66F21|nr:hypothetical protein [Shimia sp. Alg240-R146]